MLRHRIPRRGRRAPPVDVIRGHVIETLVSFQMAYSGSVINRDYVTVVDGRIVSCIELGRDDVDRAAWEMHWRIRKEFRREQQRVASPRRRRIKALVGPLFEHTSQGDLT